MGPNLASDRAWAGKVLAEMGRIPALRDLQVEQPLDYPSIDVNVNRVLAGSASSRSRLSLP